MVVRKYPFAADHPTPDTPPAAEPAAAGSELSMGTDGDGVGQVRASLAADDYRVFETAMREARDALFQGGNPQVGWAQALIEICHRSLDTVPDGSRRDRYRIHLYLDTDGTATFSDNWRLPDTVRSLLFCDATIAPVYVTGGVPVSVGRSRHIVPERTRRIVEHRDLGCRVPGCGQSRWVQVHHIVHWEGDDGPTDTWNLICLCPRHHRMHHQGHLGITGNADLPTGTPGAVTFTDTRGHRLKTGRQPGSTHRPTTPTHRQLHAPHR